MAVNSQAVPLQRAQSQLCLQPAAGKLNSTELHQTEFHCWEPKDIILTPSLAPQMGPRQLWAGGCFFCFLSPLGFIQHHLSLSRTALPEEGPCSSTGQGRPSSCFTCSASSLLLPQEPFLL